MLLPAAAVHGLPSSPSEARCIHRLAARRAPSHARSRRANRWQTPPGPQSACLSTIWPRHARGCASHTQRASGMTWKASERASERERERACVYMSVCLSVCACLCVSVCVSVSHLSRDATTASLAVQAAAPSGACTHTRADGRLLVQSDARGPRATSACACGSAVSSHDAQPGAQDAPWDARTLLWRDLDSAEHLAARQRAHVDCVRLRQRADVAVGERERGLEAIEHQHDARGWDALVA